MGRCDNWPCDPSKPAPIPRETVPFEIESSGGPAWLLDGDGLLLIRCNCGNILGSPRLHSIDADGTVNASLVCNAVSGGRPPCGWHVFGRLEGWTFGVLAKRVEKLI